MPLKFFKDLFKFDLISRQKMAGRSCQSIHLMGTGEFSIEVSSTAAHQENLQLLALKCSTKNDVQASPVARLLFDRFRRGDSHQIDITINDHLIGTCPSFISTRCSEWLFQWGFDDAKVHCDTMLYHKQNRAGRAGEIAVLLDIDQQFKMTASQHFW